MTRATHPASPKLALPALSVLGRLLSAVYEAMAAPASVNPWSLKRDPLSGCLSAGGGAYPIAELLGETIRVSTRFAVFAEVPTPHPNEVDGGGGASAAARFIAW